MCTKDFTRNSLSYFYSATNNNWDSSNQKVKNFARLITKIPMGNDNFKTFIISFIFRTTIVYSVYCVLSRRCFTSEITLNLVKRHDIYGFI